MKDFLIDFETLGTDANSVVIDLSIVVFDIDEISTLEDLITSGKKIKFSIKDQKALGRTVSESTLEWWKNQSKEARMALVPREDDFTVEEGIKEFLRFVETQGITDESHGWCRGMSFDFPILKSLIAHVFEDPDQYIPCKFWNQRDVRTAIEAYALNRNFKDVPLPKGALDNFVAHNSLSDCAKDVLYLQYSKAYALGKLDIPE